MIKRALIAFGVAVLALPLLLYGLLALVYLWGGYDTEECHRLRRLTADERLREELTRWVDSEIDLSSLDWSDTGESSSVPVKWPGQRYILEPNFDWSMLGFTLDKKSRSPEVRLITPGLPIDPHDGIGGLFAGTRSVAFLQVNRVAILVRIEAAEDFGVDLEHFKRIDGRVAVYCEPRD